MTADLMDMLHRDLVSLVDKVDLGDATVRCPVAFELYGAVERVLDRSRAVAALDSAARRHRRAKARGVAQEHALALLAARLEAVKARG